MTNVSSLLIDDECDHLGDMLQKNKDILAWSHSDMLGIDPSMASHRLNILSTT